MVFLRRFALFGAVNVGIVVMISIILQLTGLNQKVGDGYFGLMIFCLIFGTGGAFISLMISKWMAKKMYGLTILKASDPQFGWVVERTHQYARQAGLTKMPEVGIFESPDPNAFATGPSKENSLVAVSTGLTRHMPQRQAEAVIGHEVAHIANGDMVTMTLIQGVMNAFVMFLARVVAGILNNALRDNEGRGGLGFFGYLAAIFFFEMVFGILAQFVTSWFSRWREFRADAGGAALAGRENMVGALQSLQQAYPQLAKRKEEDKAMAAFRISSKMSVMRLLSTHPPLQERIAALQKTA